MAHKKKSLLKDDRKAYGLGGLIGRSVNALISKRQKLIEKAYKKNTKSKEVKSIEKEIAKAEKKYDKEMSRSADEDFREEDYLGENANEAQFELEMTVGSAEEKLDKILVALMPKADRKKYDELTELIDFKKERLSVRAHDMDDDMLAVEDGPDPLGFRDFKARQARQQPEGGFGPPMSDPKNDIPFTNGSQEPPVGQGYYSDSPPKIPEDDDIPFSKGGRVMYAEGEDVDAQMSMMMPEEEATHTMPDGTKMSGSTHAEYEQGMTPDEDMEDGYVDFIVSQSLSPEEETQLMNKLEADPELSVMFDKVLDKATEFAGSGPVEGPGSGVSDSIPARLSDGEFVLTAAATKQIGVDRLERMMEDAEMQAGAGRQQKQEGGEVEETKVDRFGKPVDKDIAEDEIKKGMMSTNPRLR
tara:strand:+ start:98 stop:1339 length:1242 start_codon:yes stop_codon:yes gene_type:complete